MPPLMFYRTHYSLLKRLCGKVACKATFTCALGFACALASAHMHLRACVSVRACLCSYKYKCRSLAHAQKRLIKFVKRFVNEHKVKLIVHDKVLNNKVCFVCVRKRISRSAQKICGLIEIEL